MILSAGEKDTFRKNAFNGIVQALEKGVLLSKAFAVANIGIDRLSVSFIEMGERSGNLGDHFKYGGERLRKQAELSQKIIGALIYPICILVVALSMVVFLIAYIFPKIMPIFTSMKVALPLSTRIMIVVADTFTQKGILLAIIFLLAVSIFVSVYKKVTTFRFLVHLTLFFIPIIKKLSRTYVMSTSFYLIGSLLRGGVGGNDAFTLVSEKLFLLPYRIVYAKAGLWSTRGGSLSQFMRLEPRYFPSLAADIVDVGERTGTLEKSFFSLALIFEKELDGAIKVLSGLIEPVLMVTVGLSVGFIALSIVTPIYEITNHVTR